MNPIAGLGLVVVALSALMACGRDEPDYVALCRDAVHAPDDVELRDPAVTEAADGTRLVSMRTTGGDEVACDITADGEVLHARLGTP